MKAAQPTTTMRPRIFNTHPRIMNTLSRYLNRNAQPSNSAALSEPNMLGINPPRVGIFIATQSPPQQVKTEMQKPTEAGTLTNTGAGTEPDDPSDTTNPSWRTALASILDRPISRTTSMTRPQSILPPTQKGTSSQTPDLTKSTCSLNLICYRSGSQGCVQRRIRVLRPGERKGMLEGDVAEVLEHDEDMFHAMRREYRQYMCGFWRRYFALKTLRQIRLLSFTPGSRPEIVPLDDFALQEIFHAYQHPASITTKYEWVDWIFRLRQEDRRHALEFVEGWRGVRIALVGSLPWVIASVVGITWTLKGGDAQTAFTVAAFILTVGTSLLALLAIVSKIES